MNKHIVIKASDAAGMGDRLRALVCGIAYARATNRKLFVDWRDGLYSEVSDNAFYRLFELANIESTKSCPVTEDVAPADWSGRLDLTFSELVDQFRETTGREWNRDQALSTYAIDLSKPYAEQVVVTWHYEQLQECLGLSSRLPLWVSRGQRERRIFQQLFNSHVRLMPDLSPRIEAIKREHFQSDVIGVHIRATREGNDRFVPPEIFEAYLDKLTCSKPDRPIFLATDNREMLERISSRYANVVAAPKWYPPNWEPMHLSEDRPSKFENAQEALVDLFLLAQCSTLLFPAGSSFSCFAAYISGAKDENIIPLLPQSTYSPQWRRKLKNLRSVLSR